MILFIIIVAYLFAFLPFSYTLIGVVTTLSKLLGKSLFCPIRFEPISILKPIKGHDPDLEKNLRSFLEQNYPFYEVIFCISDSEDPARAVIEGLMKESTVPTRLVVAPFNGGNPKVGLLEAGMKQAAHEWILVSDSNVVVENDFLRSLNMHMESKVGVTTSAVRAVAGKGLGGQLEATYLNTICARSLYLSEAFMGGYVLGKTMFFHRDVIERIGGMRTLSRYIAEDFMTGFAMKQLGLRVSLLSRPVRQTLGAVSLKAHWDRHLRWGRIRKYQTPLFFMIEWMQSFALGLILFVLATALAGVPILVPTLIYSLLWFLADWTQDSFVGGKLRLSFLWAWPLRELMAIPHWIHCAWGNTVSWRGRAMQIAPGGVFR